MEAKPEKSTRINHNGHHNNVGRGNGMGRRNQPKVVILGAGFGGLWAAHTLATKPVDVAIIDRNNYHTFFPLLYQVGAAELEPEDIAQPVRRIFWRRPNLSIYLENVEQVDFSKRVVKMTDQEIPYDYLVVALGSQPNFYGIPGATEYAFTLKSLDEGVALRNHILYCFEQATCESDPQVRQRWLTFAIVGGGPTGVEFAGALIELIRGSLKKDYQALRMSQVRVLLLEAYDHLLDGFPAPLSEYARKRLYEMGVDVHLSSQVVEISPASVSLKDGTALPCATVIWTAGVFGNSLAQQWGLKTNRHSQVEVLPTLQVPDHPEVYVIGDLAAIQQDGHPLPMVAQVAIQSGETAGLNILRQINGQPVLPFHYRDKGMLAVIGRNAAAAYMWNRTFTGFLAWIIWLSVHIFYLIGFRNRLLVLINWAWQYIFFENGVRLILPSPGLGRTKTAEAASPEQPNKIKQSEHH